MAPHSKAHMQWVRAWPLPLASARQDTIETNICFSNSSQKSLFWRSHCVPWHLQELHPKPPGTSH